MNSTFASSPAIWTAFQVLFESREFARYQSREFVFATESYGGHYGPEFVTYFNQQNKLIRSGAIKGELVEVSALMINKCVRFFSLLSLWGVVDAHIHTWWNEAGGTTRSSRTRRTSTSRRSRRGTGSSRTTPCSPR